eukprot:c11541_g1_i3.p1 GENE.c11541_g1_i3~~c11541_g1_i3.p1  ORF type:complete len:137 (+),score=29.94 c11541_g1_i3:326-736(+)
MRVKSLLFARMAFAGLMFLFWFVAVCLLIDLARQFSQDVEFMRIAHSLDSILSEFIAAKYATIVSSVFGCFLMGGWVTLSRLAFLEWWTLEVGLVIEDQNEQPPSSYQNNSVPMTLRTTVLPPSDEQNGVEEVEEL